MGEGWVYFGGWLGLECIVYDMGSSEVFIFSFEYASIIGCIPPFPLPYFSPISLINCIMTIISLNKDGL